MPPVSDEALVGEMVTEVTVPLFDPGVTVIVAVTNLLESALLVAVTEAVPALAGAVYMPADVTLPAVVVQVTDLLEVVPCTVAENWAAAPGAKDAELGEIEIELTAALGSDGEVLAAAGAETPAHPDRPTEKTRRAITASAADSASFRGESIAIKPALVPSY